MRCAPATLSSARRTASTAPELLGRRARCRAVLPAPLAYHRPSSAFRWCPLPTPARDTALQRYAVPDPLPCERLQRLVVLHQVVRHWLAVALAPHRRHGGYVCPYLAETRRATRTHARRTARPAAGTPGPRARSRVLVDPSAVHASTRSRASVASRARTPLRRARVTRSRACRSASPASGAPTPRAPSRAAVARSAAAASTASRVSAARRAHTALRRASATRTAARRTASLASGSDGTRAASRAAVACSAARASTASRVSAVVRARTRLRRARATSTTAQSTALYAASAPDHVHQVVRCWLAAPHAQHRATGERRDAFRPHSAETRPCTHGPCPIHVCQHFQRLDHVHRAVWYRLAVAQPQCYQGRAPRWLRVPVPRGDASMQLHACAKDCIVKSWNAWTSCTKSCGTGFQSRDRTLIQPRNGGDACPHRRDPPMQQAGLPA